MNAFTDLPILPATEFAAFVRQRGFNLAAWPRAHFPDSHVKACLAYHEVLLNDFERFPEPKDPAARRKEIEADRINLTELQPILRTDWGYITADSQDVAGVQMYRSFQINIPGFSAQEASMAGYEDESFRREMRSAFIRQLKRRLRSTALQYEVCPSIGDAVASVLVVTHGSRAQNADTIDNVIGFLLEQISRPDVVQSHLVRARLYAEQMLSFAATHH